MQQRAPIHIHGRVAPCPGTTAQAGLGHERDAVLHCSTHMAQSKQNLWLRWQTALRNLNMCRHPASLIHACHQ